MKYVKMLALAAVAAGALMAFIGAGTASATVLCSTTADPCPAGQAWPPQTLVFSLQSATIAKLVDTEGGVLDECSSSEVEGELTNAGSATETPTGKITKLSWGGCTFTTDTLNKACLEIHKIAGTSNGTLTADKCTGGNSVTEVTILVPLFGSCIYTIEAGKSIGDLTEGEGTGAVLHANAIAKKLSGSAFACPETAKWTATYVLTKPAKTTLSVSSS